MSATTQLTTFSDLYTDLQNRVRVQTGVTATENQAKRYINIGLHDMHLGFGEKYPWCERNATLVTQPKYTTGTLSVNQGSTTLTGSGTAWNTAGDYGPNNMRVGGKIVIGGGTDIYTISAVSSDTSATLDTAFISSDVSAESYVYFEDEYALASDFLKPIDAQFFDQNQSISIISRTEFRRRYPRSNVTGKPVVAALWDKPFSGSTTPVRKVRFWQPPDQIYLIPYSYVTSHLGVTSAGTEQAQLVNDTDEPIVPLICRHAIVLHGLWHWYRDKKDDARSQEAQAEYIDVVSRIVQDQEIGSNRPRIAPRVGVYTNHARAPWRGGGRYQTGNAFDQRRS